jgi:predicted amidohydrolase
LNRPKSIILPMKQDSDDAERSEGRQLPSLQVLGLQMDVVWEAVEPNLARAGALIEEATAAGARLVVLPEMFATGFSMAAARTVLAAPRIRSFLAESAVRHGLWVLGGVAEAGPQSRPINSAVLVSPQGREVLRYAKLHPFSLAGEDACFAAGTSLPTAEVEGVRVCPLICYDLRFPEAFRAATDRTDLYIVIASWPKPRIGAWSTLLEARAIENQAYVLGVNRVGEGDGLAYSGRSALIDPAGETLSTLADREGLVGGPVRPQAVAALRRELPFLKDRRPDLYSHL